jgi:hypothetical protein
MVHWGQTPKFAGLEPPLINDDDVTSLIDANDLTVLMCRKPTPVTKRHPFIAGIRDRPLNRLFNLGRLNKCVGC